MDSNIAIFGGTFDPIHNGHLYILRFVLEELKFSNVILIPNNISPHKAESSIPEHRLAMINLAIKEVNIDHKITIDSSEISRLGKSYTIDTIIELKKKPLYKDKMIWLVLGLDSFYSLPTWYQWQSLQQHVNFIVIDRNLYQETSTALPTWVKPYLQDKQIFQIPDDEMTQAPYGQVLIPEVKPLDISSTHIRKLLVSLYQMGTHTETTEKLNTELNALLPSAVVDYIKINQLYK